MLLELSTTRALLAVVVPGVSPLMYPIMVDVMLVPFSVSPDILIVPIPVMLLDASNTRALLAAAVPATAPDI